MSKARIGLCLEMAFPTWVPLRKMFFCWVSVLGGVGGVWLGGNGAKVMVFLLNLKV